MNSHQHMHVLEHLKQKRTKPLTCISVRLLNAHQLSILYETPGLYSLYADMQHGSLTLAEACEICGATERAGLLSFIRLQGPEAGTACAAWDAGASMVLVPNIDSLDHALKFEAFVKPSDEMQPDRVLGYMIETVEMVSSIEAIVGSSKLDFVMVGCTDLTESARNHDHDPVDYVLQSLAKVSAACERFDKPMLVGGTWNSDKLRKAALQHKAALITVGSDVSLLKGSSAVAVASIT